MAADGKKGITVKVDAALHAEITQYLQDHGMTMTEFVTMALQDELHPKINEKEGKNICLLYTSPSPRDRQKSRMPSSA